MSAAKFSLPHLHHGVRMNDFISTDLRTHAKIQLQQCIVNTTVCCKYSNSGKHKSFKNLRDTSNSGRQKGDTRRVPG